MPQAAQASTAEHRLPPGPKGLPFFGMALRVRKDPLGMLLSLARAYGDIVSIPVMGQHRILVSRPDFVQQVMLFHHAKFHKSELTRVAVGPLLGQGLLISEGDFWRRQRRLAQPAFHRSRTNAYAPAMLECARAQMQRWRDGETRNIAEEMMGLTLEVAVRTLFGTTLPGEAESVGHAMTFLMRFSLSRARSPWNIPRSWPTPRNRRATREFEFMDSLVYRIISERQKQVQGNGHGNEDLLSLLMAAMDEDGSQMTSQQLRDETMTLFVAGHETTALTLAWTWLLLSENPEAEARLHEELKSVLGGRSPEAVDLELLPFLHAVVQESLRVYPPAYIMARTSIAPVSIAGYDFPEGSTLLASQWVSHRDPRYFDDPEKFRPERWLDGLEERLPAGAYYPFGDGPRRCIGQGFALLESSLVLAEIAQRFRFKLVPGTKVVPEPLVTLRPRDGIPMTIHAR